MTPWFNILNAREICVPTYEGMDQDVDYPEDQHLSSIGIGADMDVTLARIHISWMRAPITLWIHLMFQKFARKLIRYLPLIAKGRDGDPWLIHEVCMVMWIILDFATFASIGHPWRWICNPYLLYRHGFTPMLSNTLFKLVSASFYMTMFCAHIL